MAKNKTFNLKQSFEQPIVIYELSETFRLRKGISVERVGAFVIIFLICLFLRVVFRNFFDLFPYSTILMVGVIPFFLSKMLVSIKSNGKKLFWFLYDYIIYSWYFKIRRQKISYDEFVYNPANTKFKIK
ncbi:conjugal transfer protein [Staphylococcus xylosus]|uniref:TcpE family conjugal transfer membrane protein n=1 Tax=Staphylococcus xylosus TaxID=1288 RepID=UPI00107241FB|nr:TcpE family conjugal transfer membrane protein [Staphylococcus xylosus]MBF0812029.1 conjugal transfer protein [Staphylococcus xylosus]TFV19895.1 conjugal transfer protein [Staphylococcus xylosus]